MRPFRTAAIAVAALTVTLGAAVPVAAAAEPPTLTSLTVSATSVTAPGSVTVAYAVTSDSPVTSAIANFTDDRGLLHSARMTLGPSGSGTLTIGEYAETGTWRMAAVTIVTEAGTRVRVCSPESARTATGCLEVRDLSGYDIAVTGLEPEFDAPHLATVTAGPATPRPGESVTVSWTLSSPTPDLASVRAAFVDLAGNEVFQAWSDTLLAGATSVTTVVPYGTANGVYSLAIVRLCDHVRNCAEYSSDGTVKLSGGARTPTGAQPPFAVSVRAYDDTVLPVLASVNTSTRSVVFGEPISVAYSVSDEQSSLPHLSFRYLRNGVEEFDLTRQPAPRAGTLSTTWAKLGKYELQDVYVWDGYTDLVRYKRDGTIWNSRFDTVIGRHTLDFSRLDLRIVPRAPKVSTWSWPQGVKVRPVTVDPDEAWQVTSHTIVAEPGHHVATISGTNVSSTILSGLAPGTTYTVSVTANGPGGSSAPTTFTTTPLLTSSVMGMGDMGTDGNGDIIGRQSDARGGDVLGYRGNGAGGFKGAAFNTGSIVLGRLAFPGGDLNGDAHPDLVNDNNGTLQWRRGTGRDGFITEDISLGRGWGTMRFITGGGDFSGDGRADVIGVAHTGEMYLYRGSGTGRLVSKTKINAGWGSMAGVFSPGDFDGDRARDLLAVDRSGILWLYPGNGKGGLRGTRSKVGAGWLGLAWAGPLGDFTGDGRSDVGGVTLDGQLYVYAGSGRGGIRSKAYAGAGWQRFF